MRRNCSFCGWNTLVYPPNILRCSGCGRYYNKNQAIDKNYKISYKVVQTKSGCQICKKDDGEQYCLHRV